MKSYCKFLVLALLMVACQFNTTQAQEKTYHYPTSLSVFVDGELMEHFDDLEEKHTMHAGIGAQFSIALGDESYYYSKQEEFAPAIDVYAGFRHNQSFRAGFNFYLNHNIAAIPWSDGEVKFGYGAGLMYDSIIGKGEYPVNLRLVTRYKQLDFGLRCSWKLLSEYYYDTAGPDIRFSLSYRLFGS